ncbi:MAG: trypsin-like peptidase domain-containing protein [Flavobacteriales bacterium]|nr:trypsin-like peptidase domain-containing protein [Flavobacteriales bacterium]
MVRSSLWFFDFDPFGNIGKVSSSGSGVIISTDGYIVTNHHVIKNATKIEVVLNNGKKNYQAKVIGTAESSDLALLKIEAENLTAIDLANSDDLQIGEWVLAVGNPFNLTSTVTAGIVSAKGRNINLVRNEFPIESFIQTDAAINPGNSGGALVNLDGKLVGINTAIASKTGSYVGYGFAIPSNIVIKIINDLKEYGQIQRGLDGLEVVDINDAILEKTSNLEDGVYISRITGLNDKSKSFEVGDVIIKIDGKPVFNKSNYDEILAHYRPGDQLTYTVLRKSKELTIETKLVNMDGNFDLKKREIVHSDKLEADFEVASKFECDHYGINYGVKVVNVGNGFLRRAGIDDGAFLTSINNEDISNLPDFIEKLENIKGTVQIQGIGPQGGRQYWRFYVR